MILSFVDYALAIAILVFGFRLSYLLADNISARLVRLYCTAASVVSLCIGLAYASALSRSAFFAVTFARIAASATTASFLIVALLAISFPYEKQPRILRIAAAAFWAVASYFILFTDRYLVSFTYQAGFLFRDAGPLYNPVVIGGFLLGLLSAGTLLVRRLFFRSRIFRLQTSIVAAGLIFGYLIAFSTAYVLPTYFELSWAYALMPVGAAVLAANLGFGIMITRLFDVRATALSAAGIALYGVFLSLFAGTAFALASLAIGYGRAPLVALAAAAIFVAGALIGETLRFRFRKQFAGRSAYGDKLEAELSDVDFSQGRDKVIGRLLEVLQENIGCSSVNLLIENAGGSMVNVGSTSGTTDALERKAAGIDLLLNNDVSVILKSEIVTNHDYAAVKEELLDTLGRFDADSLVLLREGRTAIGALLLGGKRTGGDFTGYDFDTLSRVYGKLFVVAYYLKNIAQESLVVTVDRELEYSDQIVQSIQENMDRISHPAVDISYMTRSTRKLGGDFIDFIRLSQDRYVFVIGDVSGKGLNASMSMVILKSVIRTFLKETKDFKKLVVKTNAFIKTNLPKGTFFAGVFGIVDFPGRTLHYVNCGIPAIFLSSSAYNNPVEIQGEGKVLGFVKDIAPMVVIRKSVFKSGDILLATTDGLTDAESVRGQRYGKERIQKLLQENRGASAERIVRFLSESVSEFVSQELNDDITILALKFN